MQRRVLPSGRKLQRITRTSGEDPSIFATALETLAIKAFGDMGQTAWLRIIRDCFIAGHNSCELRRHLDSVSPETPIWDIVDWCRVWESHADLDVRRASKPGPDLTFPTYAVSCSDGGMDDLRVAAVTTPQYAPETLFWRLLASTAAPAPAPKPEPPILWDNCFNTCCRRPSLDRLLWLRPPGLLVWKLCCKICFPGV